MPDRAPTMTAAEHLADLAAFVTASPSSFHAAAEVHRRLVAAGYTPQDEAGPWDPSSGGHVLVRDGAVLAWVVPEGATATTPYRILGSHTDSPTFTLKPNPDSTAYGWQQVGVEIYGGPLLNSWLDRELGLAGRVALVDGRVVLVQTGPVMRIPQLAIHLDRRVNDDGLTLDKQVNTRPVWGVGGGDARILDHVAAQAGCAARDVLGYDLVAFDTDPPAIFGTERQFLAAGRLDNLTGVHASMTALLAAASRPAGSPHIAMLAAFDHEEVGSGSRSGASGPLLAEVVSRISASLGASSDDTFRALSRSCCLSIDAGHAVHPNYAGHHDATNRPVLGGGPLLKINANQRYATDARGAAIWRQACRAAGVDTSEFVSSNNLPCGSTIGPLTATRLGVLTVDVGVPLLSMHSARELAHVHDPWALQQAATAFVSA